MLARTLKRHECECVTATIDPIQFPSVRAFRNWSNQFWARNLMDVTRNHLLNRMLKPNMYAQESLGTEALEPPEEPELQTPYKNITLGKLASKTAMVNSKHEIYGWEIVAVFETEDHHFDVGQELKFLYQNTREDVENICKGLGIDSKENYRLTKLSDHYPDLLCESETSALTPLLYFYDIHAPLTSIMYNTLAFGASKDEEALRLSTYAADLQALGKAPYHNLQHLLQDFKSIKLQLVDLIGILPQVGRKLGRVAHVSHSDNRTANVTIQFFEDERDGRDIWALYIRDTKLNQQLNFQLSYEAVPYSNPFSKFKSPVIFIALDAGVPFLCSYVNYMEKPKDWHVFAVTSKPWERVWIREFHSELRKKKITNLHFLKQLTKLEKHIRKNKLFLLSKPTVCLIAPKQQLSALGLCVQDCFLVSKIDLLKDDRWCEISTDTFI